MQNMKNNTGTKIVIPEILSSGSSFVELITDWIPITPEVRKIVNSKILRGNKRQTYDDYISIFLDGGIDLSYIFTDKSDDYIFPWEEYVEICTPKEELLRFKKIADKKIETYNKLNHKGDAIVTNLQ